MQVTANMRGNSAEEVAERILSQTSFSGLQVLFDVEEIGFLPPAVIILWNKASWIIVNKDS